jgi:DNA polymerase (family 10)
LDTPFQTADGWLTHTARGCPVYFHRTEPGFIGRTMIEWTGPEGHVSALKARGELGLGDETDIYRTLGLPWIPPELRSWDGAVAWVEQHGLPPLVEADRILGDLHAHTTFSDGANSLEEMAAAARQKGYRYLAITDHSQSLKVARGLSPQGLMEQGRQIDELNRQWDDFRLLKGTECDILTDGRMDFPDEVLAELDVVVASVHGQFDLPAEQQTDRILTAMRNPHVDIIGHLTGRLLLKRSGLAVNWERLLAAGIGTGTALEMNGSPHRLDASPEKAMQWIRQGGRVSLDSDSHTIGELSYMRHGIRLARRAWVPPDRVLNAQPWPVLQEWLR